MVSRRVGNYRVGRLIGQGVAGRVHLATAPDGARVAVKLLRPSLFSDRDAERRWLDEARIGARIEHENVVHVLDAGVDARNSRPVRYVVMEYVEGETLHDFLRASRRVPEPLCIDLGLQIALGLSEIHRHDVVHRDLKPDNVLLAVDGTTKIADLGLAAIHDEISRAETSSGGCGTLLYSSPETIARRGSADGRSDLYALGVILYEMAAGRHPYAGLDAVGLARAHAAAAPERLERVAPDVSPFFAEFVHQLLAKSPDERIATAASAVDALERRRSSSWWRRRAARRPTSGRTSQPSDAVGVPADAAPFVGRERELRRLRARFRAVASRRGAAVLLEGAAGTGKSRLVARLLEHVRRSRPDALVLLGGHSPGARLSASWPWVAALRKGVAPRRLGAAVRRGLRDSPDVARAFAALLDGRPPPQGAPLQQSAIESAVSRTIRALARRAPVVVVVEDLHFGPPDARRFLAEVAGETRGRRVLLIATSRPSSDERARDGPDVERIALADLDRDDTRRMLIAALRDESSVQSMMASVWLTSRGNPFAVNEVLRDLRERRALRPTADGAWTLRPGEGVAVAPRRLQSVLEARLARLRKEDLELLHVAAVVGPSFDPELVGEIAGRRAGPTRRRFACLAARTDLVRAAGDGFEFDHHLVLEAVLASMRPAALRRVRSAAADCVERRLRGASPPESDELSILLCEHLIAAGRVESIERLLPAALRAIYMRPQPHRYLALTTAALAAPGAASGLFRANVLLDVAELRAALGEPAADIVPGLREALTTAASLGADVLECRAALRLTHFLCAAGDVVGARTYLRRAQNLARRIREPEWRTRAFMQAAEVAWIRGRTGRVLRRARAAVEASRRGGGPRIRGVAAAFLFDQAVRVDDLETARDADRGLTALRSADDDMLAPRCFAHVAALALMEGRWTDADRAAGAGIEATGRRGDALNEGRCAARRSAAQSATGRPREARRWAARAASIARKQRDDELTTEVERAFGLADRAEGRLADAVARFQTVEDRFAAAGERIRADHAATLRASALVALGRFESAEAIAARVERARHGVLHDVRVALIRAEVEIARDDRDAAARALVHAGRLARRARLDVAEARVDLELAARGVVPTDSLESGLRRVREIAAATGDADLEASALAVEAERGLCGPDDASRLVARLAPRLGHEARLRAEWLLWTSGAGATHLQAAASALRRLVRHAPFADRGAMTERVRLHRDVRDAASASLSTS